MLAGWELFAKAKGFRAAKMMERCCLPIEIMLEMIAVVSKSQLGKVRPQKPIAELSTMGASAEHDFCCRRRDLVSPAAEAC